MSGRMGPALLTAYLWLVLAFLYVPIVVMAVLGFNASPLYAMPFQFDLIWYRELTGNAKLIDAGINSVGIAIVNTIIATALGTMAALAFARYRFRGRTIMQLLLFPPVAIPWLVIGTAMLVFFHWIEIPRGLFAILLGHVALSLPYVIVVVGARLATFPHAVEEAAATLGATPWQTFRRVTAPLLAPGVIGAALFAFAVSFDQFVISYFLAPPGTTTLPVAIYGAIRKGFTPEINAISTIIIVVSMGALLLTARFYRFGGER
ncbi:MAG TPA: ABC transporter permease [Dongiaceae bacterium]|nr:ABC transporter permease [Dongiaceae bacterium]